MVPMRDLLTEHAEVLGADGAGIVSRIDSALAFVDQLLAANPTYARANPQVAERIKKIKEQNRHYVAHEYFNRDWQPMAFAQMARWLEPAKVQWACSANYLDAIDTVNLSAEQQTLLASIPDPMFRQTTRDFCVNQQFRKDYWVKGSRTLTPLDQAEGLRALRVILGQPRADVSLKVNGSLGEATMQEAVYSPILDVLDQVTGPDRARPQSQRTDHQLWSNLASGHDLERQWSDLAGARRHGDHQDQKSLGQAEPAPDGQGTGEQGAELSGQPCDGRRHCGAAVSPIVCAGP
jgi:hypothetical protein